MNENIFSISQTLLIVVFTGILAFIMGAACQDDSTRRDCETVHAFRINDKVYACRNLSEIQRSMPENGGN